MKSPQSHSKSLIDRIVSSLLVLAFLCPKISLSQSPQSTELPRFDSTDDLSPFEDLVLDISQTHLAFSFQHASLGFYLVEYLDSDLNRVLSKASDFKQATLQKINGPYTEMNREIALQEYLHIYSQVIFLTLFVEAHRVDAVNRALQLTIQNPDLPMIDALKAESLIEEKPVFSISKSGTRSVDLSISNFHIEKTSQDILLTSLHSESDDLMVTVVKHLLRLQLENAKNATQQIIDADAAIPESFQSIERAFRGHLAEILAGEEIPVESFTPQGLTDDWTLQLVSLLFPGEEFTSESIQSLTTYLNESSSVHGKTSFVENIYAIPVALNQALGSSVRDQLCNQQVKSIEDGVRAAVFNLQEVQGKESAVEDYLKNQSLKVSCQLPSIASINDMIDSFRNRKQQRMQELVTELDSIIAISASPEIFAAQNIDIPSLLKYFRFKMIVSDHTLSILFRQWMGTLTDMSYSELSTAFKEFEAQIKNSAEQEGDGFMAMAMAERVQWTRIDLDLFSDFFQLGNAQTPNTNFDLANGDPTTLENMLEFWILDKKTEFPILGHLNDDGKSLIKLWSEDKEKNRELVSEFLQRVLKNTEKSLALIDEWDSLSDLDAALESSTVLVEALRSHSLIRTQFEEYSIELNQPNSVEESTKALYHKYVFTGFTGLIALQLSRFLLKFKYPRIAAYISEALSGIAPQVLHKFIISAIAMIGVDLAYETHRVLVQEQNKHDKISQFYHSSYKGDTSLIELLDYERSVQTLRKEKTAYFIRLTLDSLLLGLPLSLSVPRVQRGAIKAYERIIQRKARRLDLKITAAFQNLGIAPQNIRFERTFIDDFYQTKKVGLESQMAETMRRIREVTASDVGVQTSTSPLSPQRLQRQLRNRGYDLNQAELSQLLRNYRSGHQAYRNLQSGHQTISQLISRHQRLWIRYSEEFRFDFERLGLKPGNWDWNELGSAFRASKNRHQEGLITEKQFNEIEESYVKIMNFMLSKARQFSQTQSLKSLYLNAIRGNDPTDLSVPTDFFNTNSVGEQFGYEVISLVNKQSGEAYELIIPTLRQQGLLQ